MIVRLLRAAIAGTLIGAALVLLLRFDHAGTDWHLVVLLVAALVGGLALRRWTRRRQD